SNVLDCPLHIGNNAEGWAIKRSAADCWKRLSPPLLRYAFLTRGMMATVSLTLGSHPTMADNLPLGASTTRPGDVRPDVPAQSSFELVRRAHAGDAAARDELCARYLPRLHRWAHGRLPPSARGALDTVDLVQDTFMQVLQRLGEFEPRHEGAFQ